MLDAHRELYNAALEERRGVWRMEGRSVSRFDQYRNLTGWDHPVMAFGVCPARGTLLRLDRGFQAFFRRLRTGERAGFPRFQGKRRFDSVEYPDRSCWRIEENRLYLKWIGSVRFRTSRRGIRGTPKTLVVRLANPRFLRESLDRLASTQRMVAGRRRGSKRRAKACEALGRVHRKIANQRRDHHHKVSRSLVQRYDLIVCENLRITNLTRRPAARPNDAGGHDPNGASAKAGLNREILSAGWGQLLRMLVYKAEEAGRCVIAVDPRHSSQTCHRCGLLDGANRAADLNAARNIYRAGLALRLAREAA